MSRNRNWIFTLNLTGEEDEEVINPDAWVNSHLTYMAWQLEIAPETGQPHYQGYMEFDAQVTLAHCKALLEPHVHLEPRRGSPAQAKAYAMKPETRAAGPWEWGTQKHQGQRSDWEALKADIKANKSNAELVDRHFALYARYHKGINYCRRIIGGAKRNSKTKVTVLYGEPGNGKSTYCSTNFPGAYWKPPSNKWFDSYAGEETVIFDDFSGGWFSCDMLKRIMDNAPLGVETKGDTVEFLTKELIITTNFDVRDWYKEHFKKYPNQFDAICRRIDRLLLFNGPLGQYEEADPKEYYEMHRPIPERPVYSENQRRYGYGASEDDK